MCKSSFLSALHERALLPVPVARPALPVLPAPAAEESAAPRPETPTPARTTRTLDSRLSAASAVATVNLPDPSNNAIGTTWQQQQSCSARRLQRLLDLGLVLRGGCNHVQGHLGCAIFG
jgi:hypothetical protein